MMTQLDITIADVRLTLLPERALYMAQEETLFVADPHFGKAATFRASSIAIPGGSTQEELVRLTSAVQRTSAKRLIFLGDLLHTRRGRDAETLGLVAAWRQAYADLDVVLVRGNHDVHAGDPPDDWQMRCVDAPYLLPPFVLQHHPIAHEDGYVLAGHLHPAARLMAGRQQLKLPCFWFGERVGVLPAFGSFTDMGFVTPRPRDRVYVVADDEVIAVAE